MTRQTRVRARDTATAFFGDARTEDRAAVTVAHTSRGALSAGPQRLARARGGAILCNGEDNVIVQSGMGVSTGIVMGQAWVLDPNVTPLERHIDTGDVRGELRRLEHALLTAEDQLGPAPPHQPEVGEDASALDHDLIEAQRQLLADPSFAEACRQGIRRGGLAAESAVRRVIQQRDEELEQDASAPFSREESVPLHAVGNRLMRLLLRLPPRPPMVGPAPNSIAVTRDLWAHDIETFRREGVRGVVSQHGSNPAALAHEASTEGVTCVIQVPHLFDLVTPGVTLALDGEHGIVVIEPDEETTRALLSGRFRSPPSAQDPRIGP